MEAVADGGTHLSPIPAKIVEMLRGELQQAQSYFEESLENAKQDALAAKCAEHDSCDHVYFTRALIGLYESRETASKYFEKVLAVAPKGQLAGSSRLWLQLLQEYPAPNERSWMGSVMIAPAISDGQVMLGQTSDRLVRDLHLRRRRVLGQRRRCRQLAVGHHHEIHFPGLPKQ